MAFLLRERERESNIYLFFTCCDLKSVHSLLALFVFESFTHEVAFHLDVVFQ